MTGVCLRDKQMPPLQQPDKEEERWREENLSANLGGKEVVTEVVQGRIRNFEMQERIIIISQNVPGEREKHN